VTRAPYPQYETAGNEFYVFDAWNRLAQVWQDTDGGHTLDAGDRLREENRYDGLGRRTSRVVWKYVDSTVKWDRTDFYYNEAWQVLEERRTRSDTLGTDSPASGQRGTVATTPYAQYVWDLRYVDAPVLRWRNTDWQTDVVTTEHPQVTFEETVYYTNDANMNVTALVDGKSDSATFGQVVSRIYYNPYGKLWVCTGDWSYYWDVALNGVPLENEITYCGYRWEYDTMLYYVRHRVYHATLQRWLQRDPIGYAEGMNWYAYLGARPPCSVDPAGLGDPGASDVTLDSQPKTSTLTYRGLAGADISLRLDPHNLCRDDSGGFVTVTATLVPGTQWQQAAATGQDAAPKTMGAAMRNEGTVLAVQSQGSYFWTAYHTGENTVTLRVKIGTGLCPQGEQKGEIAIWWWYSYDAKGVTGHGQVWAKWMGFWSFECTRNQTSRTSSGAAKNCCAQKTPFKYALVPVSADNPSNFSFTSHTTDYDGVHNRPKDGKDVSEMSE
jgi:RHS repeat-associated protein